MAGHPFEDTSWRPVLTKSQLTANLWLRIDAGVVKIKYRHQQPRLWGSDGANLQDAIGRSAVPAS